MRFINRNNGFTLLEVIISIAAISFISIFILQMYMLSSSLNRRAGEVDNATAEAVSKIENLKKHSSFSGYLESESLQAALLNNSTIIIRDYYDKDWNCIYSGAFGSFHTPADADYYLSMDITADSDLHMFEGEESSIGRLYIINVDVIGISDTGIERTLVSLCSKKYFPVN